MPSKLFALLNCLPSSTNTRIRYSKDLRALVSCSLDGTLQVNDLQRGLIEGGPPIASMPVLDSRGRAVLGPNTSAPRGLYSFCWCSSNELFAVGGTERVVHLWNHNIKSRTSLFELRGHTSSIVDVCSDSNAHQLLSLSADSCLKIWDIRTMACVQTIDRYDFVYLSVLSICSISLCLPSKLTP